MAPGAGSTSFCGASCPFGESGKYRGGISYGSISVDANGNLGTADTLSTLEVVRRGRVVRQQQQQFGDLLFGWRPFPDVVQRFRKRPLLRCRLGQGRRLRLVVDLAAQAGRRD